jgi:small subunit ribosomal protein S6
METAVKKKLYEGMFLVDSAQASDWDKVIATLEAVLQKADSEIVSMRKWDDRKLAYEIEGKARGTYILCYFRADGRKVQEIERAVQLSEQIMRVLILSAEAMSKEHIEKDTPATKAEKQRNRM